VKTAEFLLHFLVFPDFIHMRHVRVLGGCEGDTGFEQDGTICNPRWLWRWHRRRRRWYKVEYSWSL